MTLKAIKAMFIVGERWHVIRTDPKGLTIHPNVGPDVVIPPSVADENRTILKVGSNYVVWKRNNNPDPLYMNWPKASQIIEAHEGFLNFTYDTEINIVATKLA